MQERASVSGQGPMAGVRIVDLGTATASGIAGELLGDFGAEIIHVEQPGTGNGIRQLGPFSEKQSLRWAAMGRNKQSIAVDLRQPGGRQVLLDLVKVSDVVLENFRPGTLDRWNLSYQAMREVNPRIILLSLSGYGQTGPRREEPGFGRVVEAGVGLMSLTGPEDGPPMQVGFWMIDAYTGMCSALAIAMAVRHRDATGSREGQWIDVALNDLGVRLISPFIAQVDKTGKVPRRHGNRNPNAVPSDVFRTKDNRWAFCSGPAQTVFERLMLAIGREDLLADPRLATNTARIQHADEVNAVVAEWFESHTYAEVAATLHAHDVPVGVINTIADVLDDPQVLAREMIVEVDDPAVGRVKLSGIMPKFSATPGSIRRPSPRLGEHTDQILRELLAYDDEQIALLRQEGAVG